MNQKNETLQEASSLLHSAVREIRNLRRDNQVMRGKLEIVYGMMELGNERRANERLASESMTLDQTWQMEKVAEAIRRGVESEEETSKEKAREEKERVLNPHS